MATANGFRVICVGTMEQFYKRQDTLLHATARCVQRGDNIRLVLVGDGRCRLELERLATTLGISSRCEFVGQLPSGKPITEQLDNADLFVLASQQEGLPRAMIEAMARGLPCIGTRVGGIPELLESDDMVEAGDTTALADKIHAVLSSSERRSAMSARSLRTAREYTEEVLAARRNEFYRHISQVTSAWNRVRR
jgi:glycosyltransferase involved in cell wall biosynthesis